MKSNVGYYEITYQICNILQCFATNIELDWLSILIRI